MTGLHETTVSPSRPRMTRSTPWVAGCCGPMFTSRISVWNIRVSWRFLSVPRVLLREPLEGVFLPERVALPVIGKQDARQVGMAGEADAEEIERLALVPVCRRPDRADGRNAFAVGHAHLEAYPVAMRYGIDVVVDLEPLRLPGIVGGAQIGQQIELRARVGLQEPADVGEALDLDSRRHLPGEVGDVLDRVGELLPQAIERDAGDSLA